EVAQDQSVHMRGVAEADLCLPVGEQVRPALLLADHAVGIHADGVVVSERYLQAVARRRYSRGLGQARDRRWDSGEAGLREGGLPPQQRLKDAENLTGVRPLGAKLPQ